MNKTYFPPLTAPAHLLVAPSFPTGVGDASAAATLEMDLYLVSLDGSGKTSALTFDFYNEPFYSGYATYTVTLTGQQTGQWLHLSIPRASFTFGGGMTDWSQVGILQLKSGAGAFDLWIDNCGFQNSGASELSIVLVDGAIDSWSGTYSTPPASGTPPVSLAPSGAAATHFISPGGTDQWANLSRPSTGNNFMTMVSSLAGVLLKQGCNEGIWVGGVNKTLTELVNRRSITYENYTAPRTFWDVVDHFKTQFGSRYVLYDNQANPDSTNAARMAAYTYEAVMVDKSIESEAIAHGLTRVIDVSSATDEWIRTNWWPTWGQRDMAIDNDTSNAGVFLNDYAAAAGALCFREASGTALRLSYLTDLDMDSPVMGWPDDAYGELNNTQDNSVHDTFNEAVATHLNVALLSAYRDASKFPLVPKARALPATQNKHYVAFLWSDGDNVSWHEVYLPWSANWWGSAKRGQFPVGWGINPSCRDFGQPNVEYMYATATSNAAAQDDFVAFGPIGYGYPSQFSDQCRTLNAERLNLYMDDLGLRVLNLLDKSGFETPLVYLPYMQQSNIDAILYWDVWGNYAKYQGASKWVAGKPIISLRRMMNDADALATVNSLPTDPVNANSYSLIGIHAWTATMDDVADFIAQLDPDVEVVTPNELVKLFVQNVGPAVLLGTQEIDTGNWQRGVYDQPGGGFTVTVNSTQQMTDATPSTKFTISTVYNASNMNFLSMDASNGDQWLTFDLHGDGSGAIIRLELYSTAYQAFVYVDVALDFTGWRHFEYAMNGSNGLQAWAASFVEIESSMDIWQVSGPWNETAATFYLDNVKISGREANVPVTLSLFQMD